MAEDNKNETKRTERQQEPARPDNFRQDAPKQTEQKQVSQKAQDQRVETNRKANITSSESVASNPEARKRVVDSEVKVEDPAAGRPVFDENGVIVEQNLFPSLDEDATFQGTGAGQRLLRKQKEAQEQNEENDQKK
jgi:hypothetical protein